MQKRCAHGFMEPSFKRTKQRCSSLYTTECWNWREWCHQACEWFQSFQVLTHQAALQSQTADPVVTAVRVPSRTVLHILEQYHNEISRLCQAVKVAPPPTPVWTSDLVSLLQELNQEFQKVNDRLQQHLLGQAHVLSIGVRITKQPLTIQQVQTRLQQQLVPLVSLHSTLSTLMAQ